MKSINTYISESIYGNLAVDDDIHDGMTREWVEKYNKQLLSLNPNTMVSTGNTLMVKNGVICGKTCGGPIFLYIRDENILENGHIPTWLKFNTAEDSSITVNIMTDKFTSFEGFPKVKCMFLNIYSQIDCFDTITNCKTIYLNIFTDSPRIANVKPMICGLEFLPYNGSNKNLTSLDPHETLSNITGCKFKAFNAGIVGKISNNIAKSEFKNTEVLSKFFRDNKFDGKFEIKIGTVPDLEFLDDVPQTMKITVLHIKPKDWRKWMREFNENKQIQYISQLPQVDKFFDPVKRNKNKFNKEHKTPIIKLDISKDNLGKDAIYQLSCGFLEHIYIS